jgi:hypothetical protein
VGSGKSLKGHIEFGKHNICALCVVDGWQTTQKKKKKKKKTQNVYYCCYLQTKKILIELK